MRHLALAALVTLLAACGSRLATTPDQTPSPQPALSPAPMPSPTEPDVLVSAPWIEFFVYDGDDLREVREVDKPFIFGGSVRHGDGIECRTTDGRAEIVHRSVSNNTSDFQWDVVERVYQWQGKADLVPWSMRTLTIPVVHERDQPPEPWRYWALSCGKLRTPPSAFP